MSVHLNAPRASFLGWPEKLPWLLGVGLLLAMGYSFWTTVGKPDCQDLDFGAYYRAAVAVSQGRSPYGVDAYGSLGAYTYAPAFAYLCLPLTALDYVWACRLWMLVNWGLTALGLCLALQLALPVSMVPRQDLRVAVLAVLATAAYIWANLRVGQAAMLLTVACLGWAACLRAGRPFVGGILLAFASALKLSPLVLVPYPLLRRDWRCLAGLIAGSGLLTVIPTLWVGEWGTLDLHRAWLEQCRVTQIPVQSYRPGNQSLLAQLARLPPVGDGHHLYSAEALATLVHLYPFVVLGLTLGLHFWIWYQSRNGCGGGSLGQKQARAAVHLALLLVFLTLAHPRAWRCNFVLLLQPCVLLAQAVCQGMAGSWIALGGLGAMVFAEVWPTHGIGETGWQAGAWLLLGKHFWGALLVAGACWWIGRASSRGQEWEDETTREPAVTKRVPSP